MDIFMSLNINIAAVMKNLKMSKFVLDHLKTKRMCRHAVKKLLYLLSFIHDQCKTQQMCNKTVQKNGGRLDSVPDCTKIKGCVIK